MNIKSQEICWNNERKSGILDYRKSYAIGEHRFVHERGYHIMAIQHIQPGERSPVYQTMQEDFGALIDRVRRRSRIEIQEIAALFPKFLPEWDRYTYTHTAGERKRTPRVKELFPLYQALVISGVHFTPAERNQFVALARQA